jgi:hypothetical protein
MIGWCSESDAVCHLHYFMLIYSEAAAVKVIMETETDLTNGGQL